MTPRLTLTEFEPLDGYRLQLSFNDGRTGTIDLASTVTTDSRPVFAPLRDLAVFRQVRLEHGSLAWPTGLDLAPEFLYFMAFRDDPTLQNKFEAWGYLAPQEAS